MKRVVLLILLILLLPTHTYAKEKESRTYSTVIVGGGIAGLTAAYQLKKKDILLLEKHPGVGGRIWDGNYRGFSYARGAEYIGEPEGVMKKLVKKLKLKPIEIISPAICHYNPSVPGYPNTTIYNGYYGIAFMHVTEDGGDKAALRNYNRFQSETTDFVDETYDAGELPHMFDLSHPVAKYDYVTMRQWFVANGFNKTYQNKWNSHARGLYGANMDEVSALMMISELGWEYYEEDDIEMPDISWNDYEQDQYATETYTFEGGLSALPKAIASDKKLKGKIKTNSLVTHVKNEGGLYKVTYENRLTGNKASVMSKSVVMAVPADVALKLAPDIIKGETRSIMETIKYCQYLTVNMFSDKPLHTISFELSTPEDFFAVSFYDSLYVEKLENPGNPLNDKVFITTAYIAGDSCNDDLVGMSDMAIIQKTFRDISRIYPGALGIVKSVQVNRFAHGYPLMGLGAYHSIARLNKLNMRSKSFRLVGDYLALPTLEATMEQAMYAVKKLKVK